MILKLASIAAGGALGALFRYGLSSGIHLLLGRGFPYGTLVVNVVGSFLIGVLYGFVVERRELPEVWQSFLIVGLLGAFTTFSTFSLETLALIENQAIFKGVLNILLSLGLCIGTCWLGLFVMRQINL